MDNTDDIVKSVINFAEKFGLSIVVIAKEKDNMITSCTFDLTNQDITQLLANALESFADEDDDVIQ